MARKPNWLDPFLKFAGIASQDAFAEAIGVHRVTVNRAVNDKTGMDRSDAAKWAKALRVSPDEVMLRKLAAGRLIERPELTYTKDDPSAPEPINPDAGMSIGSETGAMGIPTDASQQIDVTAGLGAGGVTITLDGVPNTRGITFSAEVVSDYWRLPPSILGALHLKAREVTVMPVQGNSMAPTLLEGDFVFVDTRHRVPSPDGVYALEDEYGGIIVKTLRAAEAGGEEGGPFIDVVSDNNAYPTKRKRAEDVRVIGRIVRRFSAVF